LYEYPLFYAVLFVLIAPVKLSGLRFGEHYIINWILSLYENGQFKTDWRCALVR